MSVLAKERGVIRDQRRLAAIVCADVVGYSRLMERDESATLAALKAHQRDLIAPAIAEFGGRIVKTTGDGLLAEFPSVVDAVRSAVEVQRGMVRRNASVPEDRQIRFRIGVNVGDIIIDDDDIFGDGVNVAARLQTLADPGSVIVSRAVRDQLRGKADYAFEDLGEHAVKNIERPIEVFRVLDDTSSATSTSAPAGGAIARSWVAARHFGSRSVRTGAIALAAFALIGGWLAVDRYVLAPRARDTVPLDSIAVLPLANLSGDPAQEYFADGMTDAVITELSRVSGLRVISRTSVMQYKGAKKPLPEIARALGVRGIIEGSVLRDGDQVKITVQLISAPTDTHLWAQDYVRDMRSILALQSEVARAIAGQVKSAVAGAPAPAAVPARTGPSEKPKSVDPEAFDLYLRAKTLPDRAEIWKRRSELYEQATLKDPGFAAAYGALSVSLTSILTHGQIQAGDALPRARLAAQRASELDPDDLDAMKAGFAVAFHIARDFRAAETAARRILQLFPNDSEAHRWLAMTLALFGRFDEAIAEGKRAVELDPHSSIAQGFLGFIYYFARRYDECIGYLRANSVADPPSFLPYLALSTCLDATGRYDEGAQTLYQGLVLWGDDPTAVAQLVTAQARGGYHARTRARLDHYLHRTRQGSHEWGEVAYAYALLGQKQEAFHHLDLAYEAFDSIIFQLEDPGFDGLRDDPRWAALLRRLNLQDTPMAKIPAAKAWASR